MQSRAFLLAGLASACIGTGSAQLLFEDTFERPNSSDINAATTGITNHTGTTFTAGAWRENYEADANVNRTNIGGLNGDAGNNDNPGILFLADGVGTSNVYVNHNFTNASILAAGGFAVETSYRAAPVSAPPMAQAHSCFKMSLHGPAMRRKPSIARPPSTGRLPEPADRPEI